MTSVDFCTPIEFRDPPKSYTESLLATVDSYFYLGGKKAVVIPDFAQNGKKGAILTQDSPAFLTTALKMISYCMVIPFIVMLISKAVLRSMHRFHIIDVRQKIEEGIDVSQETIQTITTLMPKIQGRKDDPEISWYRDGCIRYNDGLVFGLTSLPNRIFKTSDIGTLRVNSSKSPDKVSKERFANIIKAQEICLLHRLDRLVIPHAKVFQAASTLHAKMYPAAETTLIVEECLKINQNESAQEHFYQTLSGLNETVRQLAIFIAKTGFSDVRWEHIPLLDTAPLFEGNRRIALINLKKMDDNSIGFFGNNFARIPGLIQCLCREEHIDTALTVAHCHGIGSRYNDKARQMKKIQNDQELQKFYAQKEISEEVNPRKPIYVHDLTTLGLDLNEKGPIIPGKTGLTSVWTGERPVIMKTAITDVVAIINKIISHSPEDASLKGKRHIKLDPYDKEYGPLLKEYGLEECYFFPETVNHKKWLNRILIALEKHGYLFKFEKIDCRGYFFQA